MTADARSGPPDSFEQLEQERTTSGIPVRPLYTGEGLGDVADRLGYPGHPPFTRGPYETMYRGRLWTMRQYAGFGSAQETNERYRYLLGQGQTALSVAFDLPTQLGYDSDAELADGEVGRVGVAIDTVDDMCALFDGLPLDELSVNFTINATSPIILAFYLVAAGRQGVRGGDLAGTLQNDILKEFLARKAFIYPPEPSMRLVADVIEHSARELPRFNPISITGYHAREAGCDAVQELGLTMASAVAYVEQLLRRGLDVDSFAPRLSFHFSTTLDLFEEVAKLRAARRLWYRIATERFHAEDERSGRLRFFSGNAGATLTVQQPLNNVIRSTIQCLGAVLGGAQSIHVMGYDEALEIPSEEAVRLALRTQQIIAYEAGVTRTIDPLAGSYYVETLTDELEARAADLVSRIDDLGGAVTALADGVPQRWIAQAAYDHERRIASGETVKVGVNAYELDEEPEELRLFEVDPASQAQQIDTLQEHRRGRDSSRAVDALRTVEAAARGQRNVMPPLIDAATAGCTLGELADVLRGVFGEYEEPAPW